MPLCKYHMFYTSLDCYSTPKTTYCMSTRMWYLKLVPNMADWQHRKKQECLRRGIGTSNHTSVKEKKDSTFFQLRPKLPYDIFHQKGAALPVSPNMLLSWLLTERECSGECDGGVKLCYVKLCSSYAVVCETSGRLRCTCTHTASKSESCRTLIKVIQEQLNSNE